MSWWVGKDRDAFKAALEDHTHRVVRVVVSVPALAESVTPPEPPLVVAPQPSVIDVPPPPARYAKQRRYRASRRAKGLCPRCGDPTDATYNCARCQAGLRPTQAARARQRRGHQPWRPGSRGRVPSGVKPYLAIANALRDGILTNEDYQSDPMLQRAAVVMSCGFFLRQDPTWIVPWTGYSAAAVARISRNLRRAGIWGDDRSLACEWMDALLIKRPSKAERFKADVAFLLDALVAKGDVARETRNGEFFYSLPERDT